MERVRIDKWLWAARMFKTRALAKRAIESGHISCNGARPKPSKEIETGTTLTVRRGDTQITIIVQALSDQRRGAPEAQALYQETPESVDQREQARLQRKFSRLGLTLPARRPTKRDRRAIDRFQQQNEDD